ncbi:MAG: hypothetical protein KBD42_12875 [Chitinophagales bacterium]|jgi:hypothetical protein|nr:hypothetical protein [Chitinophagales bacterium]
MKYIILTITLIFSITLFSQKNNCISLKIGEVAYTDWVNRYGLQPSIAYTYSFLNQIEISNVASFYYYDKLWSDDIPMVGHVDYKMIFENNFRVGYQFNSKNNLTTSAGTGISLRYRIDDIIVANDESELVGRTYGGLEVGCLFYFDVEYSFSEKYSLGLFSQVNLYVPTKDATFGDVTHKSPSALSYGLSIGRHF